MKKVIMMLLGVFIFIHAGSISTEASEKPDYEKYGKIAIAVVQADYPENEVTDYEYKGRKTVAKNFVEDGFKFLVATKGTEFNVIVTVQHDLRNKKLLSLKVTEQK
ncbi:YqzG/YhdC family protein [Peribacillus muralis]|uniref:DUF3889 domain-containing protein n=1 Tax=Peribacillus muralis TaxID=264697 RepID=UPI001F4D7909|nr:DUF3889 domain-containing protein [Peribacillus muralis]MCK1993104.1 YqzG/YhdC family protein [Peribacillus muralis]MCK2013659.1 YqzG/YhdC family protein [Peribacillus muralis]